MASYRTWKVLNRPDLIGAKVKIIQKHSRHFLVELFEDFGNFQKGERFVLKQVDVKPQKVKFEY